MQAFLDAMLTKLFAAYSIDTSRVYSTSSSNGDHSRPGGNPNNNHISTQINGSKLMRDFFQQSTLGFLNTSAAK